MKSLWRGRALLRMAARETKMTIVTNVKTRATAAVCGGAALLVLAGGWSPAGAMAGTTTAAESSSVTPVPPSPSTPGGALPVRPAGGGACIIGLNCGCIRNITCPKPRAPRPGNANDQQHSAPAPPNP